MVYGPKLRPSGVDCASWRQANRKFCDVEMLRNSAEGKCRIHIRLVKKDDWKFDDIYFNEINGRECGHWASYIRDHEIAFLIQFYAEHIFRVAKNTLDISKSFLEVVNELHKLQGSDRPNEPRKKQRQGEPVDESVLRTLELLARQAEKE